MWRKNIIVLWLFTHSQADLLTHQSLTRSACCVVMSSQRGRCCSMSRIVSRAAHTQENYSNWSSGCCRHGRWGKRAQTARAPSSSPNKCSENGIKMQRLTQITFRRPVQKTFGFARLSGTRLSSSIRFQSN